MFSFVALLHVVGWGVLVMIVAPQHLQVSSAGFFGVGLGVTAYTLGLRHAFDADHIAAIDNTTRKLMHDGGKPLTVGFWFSLGHSSVVLALCVLLATGIRMLAGQVESDQSATHQILGLVGAGVSGLFLWIIGILNLVVLIGIVKVFRGMRRGEFDESEFDDQLKKRGGFANRVFGRVGAVVRRPRHMYVVGLLFGLGFDTATEVGLLVLAGGAAAFALPWYALLTLPILFAAGMSLLDSLDGVFMTVAYNWAFTTPVRKVYYNVVITALSVAVALVIGTIEVVSIVVDRAGITSGPLAAIGSLDLNSVGYAIVAIFVLSWVIALAAWRFGRIEERWCLHRSVPRSRPVTPGDTP
ncbi:HoxN/HupN/NixA family nickel/cobalt transporter [Subtercola sp. PAMC28395]|nr:HoxN/HupN/NixA family nickel/cobalt transporter [Subtercola sp. PAMC28395]